jgi:hypothetical protein
MSYEERVVTRRDETTHPSGEHMVVERRAATYPSGSEMVSRVVIFLFGLIQALIIARIVLLLLDAREGNALVAFILDASQLFVAPFEGILRTNALTSGGSVLDIAAIAALIGWTILEMLILAGIRIFRREPA